jgi:GNAT superfamily N-acetyltransferase
MAQEVEEGDLSGVVEKLTAQHDLRGFRCGKPSLDVFLKRYALKNQEIGSSRTYVVHRSGRVVAYYSLTYGSVEHAACPEKTRSGMPEQYEIPVVVLARLAVDRREQHKGLGSALIKDACLRVVSASEIAGLRAVLVHAIDESAKAFYKRFGFEDCPTSDLQVMMTVADLRQTFESVQAG